MTKKLFSTVFLFSVFIASAQTDTLQNNLDEVVVTATKTAIKQSQTGKVVTVIDRATIERNIGKSVSEILNYQSGIFINGANNAFGTNQDVYLRGASTGHALIMIDGVPVIDASQINNSFDLNSINISQIERIEILKGAQSTLWGSDAMAGVINIITKKGGAKATSPNILLSYGSYNTFKGNVGVNGKLKDFTYNLNYSRVDTRGFSAAYDSTGNKGFDNDGLVQNNFQANLGYKLSQKLSVSSLIQAGKYTADIDAGAFQDDKDYISKNRNNLYNLGLEYKASKLNFHLINTLQKTKRELIDDSTHVGGFSKYAHGNYDATTFISDLYGNYSFSNKASLIVGAQGIYQNTDQGYMSISSFGPYKAPPIGADSANINNYSVYASFLLTNLSGFNNEIGFRYNNHSIYGSNATFSFNPSFNIDENTRVFLNISSGYKIPTLYQLYSEAGNKNLNPEKSINYELGVQAFSNNKRNSFRVLGFKRDIKNLIVYYSDPVTYAAQYINRDKQNDYGFEFESNIALDKIGNWLNNLTYVDGAGENNNVKTKNLFRRPNFTYNSTLTIEPVKGLTVAPSFRFVGTRIKGTYDAGPAQMPQYYTLDFYAAYSFVKQCRLFVDLRNITNQQYFDVPGYNSRRFNFMAGISANF
ncbi:MAG TPA: TonB-dependent receptor [Segetibacter sp.]